MKNVPVRVIDSNFNFLGEIDNYESLQFKRCWHKVGDFELHININKEHTDILQEDNLIILEMDKFKVGVIRHREIKVDEQGKQSEELIIKGYTLKGIVQRRITVPPAGQGYDRLKANAETIMKHYADANCVNPSDIKRKIPQLIIATDMQKGLYTPWQSRYKQLDLELEEISNYTSLGWDVYLDIENKKFVFEVYEGRNYTTSQDALPPVIFSIDFDNIKAQQFSDSAIGYKNTGYVGGQGEEEDRVVIQVGEYEGLDRIETFIDARDIEDATELPIRGQQKLKETDKIRSFESEILMNGPFIYGQDWDLGDIVTVQNVKWNITMDTRITEVLEVWEVGGYRVQVTFGNNIPSFIEKIKKEFNKPLAEKGVLEKGESGISLQYSWNGTQLGIKREDETVYQYVNLIGPQGSEGKQGTQGPIGLTGKSLEFLWNGTQLGVRLEGQTSYQYVDLKGPKGDQGIQGVQGLKGDKGDPGTTDYNNLINKPTSLPANGGNADTVDGKHASDLVPLTGGKFIDGGLYMDTHPENGRIILPFINNDIAFLLKRGGNATIKKNGAELSLDISNAFDGTPSYWAITGCVPTDKIEIELVLHKAFTWGNTIGISFGASAWRAKDITIQVMRSGVDTDWVTKGAITSNAYGQYTIYTSHLDGTGFDRVRFIMTNLNSSGFRIAQIFVLNYGSYGLKETFLSRGGCDGVYGDILPFTNNAYSLGSSSRQWKNLYATNFISNGQQVVLNDDSRLSDERTPKAHTHTKSEISDMPTKLSDFTNDIGAGGGVKITTAATAPVTSSPGDFWYKEV